MQESRNVTINISSLTIIKVFAVVLGIAFLYLIREVIGIVLVAFVLASALTPLVDWLQVKLKTPRVFNIIIVFVFAFGVVSIILALLIPAIVTQIGDIANNFPAYFERLQKEVGNVKDFNLTQSFLGNLETNLQSLRANVGQTTSGIFSAISAIFGGIFSFIGVLVITFYLIMEEQITRRFLQIIVPPKYYSSVTPVLTKIQVKLGAWLRGQGLLSLIIFLVTYLGLSLLGIKNALVLALFAGLTEFIPYVGSVIGAIPAVFFGFTQSSWQGLAVIALYIIVQQLENNILVPKVMQKTVGLNPLIIIIGMLIGAKVAGIIGLLLAVPTMLIIEIIAKTAFHIDEGELLENIEAKKKDSLT